MPAPVTNLTFHHLGVATRSKQGATRFLEALGYVGGEEVYDPLQKVNLCMYASESLPRVEVITPADEPGPLDRILKSLSEAPYHYCYETTDLRETLAAFDDAGCRVICVSPPQPAVLFEGKLVSFYIVHGFGLVELLEAGSTEQ